MIAVAILLVVVIHDDGQCELGVFVHRLDVPATIIVADSFDVAFDHQLADPAAVDAELAAFVKVLNPVAIALLVDDDSAFSPHGRYLLTTRSPRRL